MIKHLLEQCKNMPEYVKTELSSPSEDTTSTSLPSTSQNLQNTLLSKLYNQSNKKQKTQTKIDNYADKCSSEEQKEYLAHVIFGSGLPLSLVEDEYFKAFC